MSKHLQTPFFLINEELLRQNIDGFCRALNNIWPNSILAYSIKTNSLPWILRLMNQYGVYVEAVSDEEYQLAKLSGYSDEKIVFNGPIKSNEYLDVSFSGGSIVNLDSEHELEHILENHPPVHGLIGIRVNIDPSVFEKSDVAYQEDGFRFGFCAENGELERAIRAIRCVYGEIPIGLHMHVNSITRSVSVYQAIARYGADIIQNLHLKPPYIDIGGGFFGGVPGKATPSDYIQSIRDELERVVDTAYTKLIIEPGSAIIGSTTELHTSVIDVKDTVHARIVTTDGSRVYIDPLWVKKNYTYKTNASRRRINKQIICGYTCMDHDRIMVMKNEPELSVGDNIIYQRVGNYTVTFGGPFIRPLPPVYISGENGIQLIRRQMSVEEYYRMETI